MTAQIVVICPECQNRMVVPSDQVRSEIVCEVCRRSVTVGAASERTAPASHAENPRSDRDSRNRAVGKSTDAPLLLAGVIGAAATAILYGAVLLPLSDQPVAQLFLESGAIPYAMTLVTFWGLAILALQYLEIQRQLRFAASGRAPNPMRISDTIAAANADELIQRIDGLPPQQRYSILGRRMHGALCQVRSRNNVTEVQHYLTSQGDLASRQVDVGYTIVRAFIKVVAILGLIGTLVTFSAAIGSLDLTLAENSTGVTATANIGNVATELPKSFNPVLMGLCMAIVLLLATETVRHREHRMLDQIHDFANDSLLRQLADPSTDEELPRIVRDALEAAFQEHQVWLAQWQVQVSELGRVIGGDFAKLAVEFKNQKNDLEQRDMDVDQIHPPDHGHSDEPLGY